MFQPVSFRSSCWLLSVMTVVASGCQGMNHAESGALLGAGLGTAAGAVIGHQSGQGAQGAFLGAVTGTMAGAIIGDAEDARNERDAAIAQAQALQYSEPALTNYDLVRMTQGGLGDEVIINSLHDRGGRFDLSPDGLIQLRTAGVSDRVIVAVQQAASKAPPTTVASSRSSPVVIVPRVQTVGVGVVVGPRPMHAVPHRHYRYRGHHGRHGTHVHWW